MPDEVSLPPGYDAPHRRSSFPVIIVVLVVVSALVGITLFVLYDRDPARSLSTVKDSLALGKIGQKILGLKKNCTLMPGGEPSLEQLRACAITSPPGSRYGGDPLTSFNSHTGETIIGGVKYIFSDGNTQVGLEEFVQCGPLEDYHNRVDASSSLNVRKFLSVLPSGSLLVVNNDQTWIVAMLRTSLTDHCWR